MPMTTLDAMSWWWLFAAYWLVSIPVAVMLGRLLRYGAQDEPPKE